MIKYLERVFPHLRNKPLPEDAGKRLFLKFNEGVRKELEAKLDNGKHTR